MNNNNGENNNVLDIVGATTTGVAVAVPFKTRATRQGSCQLHQSPVHIPSSRHGRAENLAKRSFRLPVMA
jgi:hypothetical protein